MVQKSFARSAVKQSLTTASYACQSVVREQADDREVRREHRAVDPKASIAQATELLPSVATVLLPATKHVAELEQPERVNKLILDHVAARA